MVDPPYLPVQFLGSTSILGQPALKAIQDKIKSSELEDGFSVRDLNRKAWKNIPRKAEQIKQLLDELVEANWLKISVDLPEAFAGRPPSEKYLINPRIHEIN
jgi:hypothetical protein